MSLEILRDDDEVARERSGHEDGVFAGRVVARGRALAVRAPDAERGADTIGGQRAAHEHRVHLRGEELSAEARCLRPESLVALSVREEKRSALLERRVVPCRHRERHMAVRALELTALACELNRRAAVRAREDADVCRERAHERTVSVHTVGVCSSVTVRAAVRADFLSRLGRRGAEAEGTPHLLARLGALASFVAHDHLVVLERAA